MIQVGETIKIFAEGVDQAERESILAQELSRPKVCAQKGGPGPPV